MKRKTEVFVAVKAFKEQFVTDRNDKKNCLLNPEDIFIKLLQWLSLS